VVGEQSFVKNLMRDRTIKPLRRQPEFDFRNVERGMAALREMIEHYEKKETKAEQKPKVSIEDRRRLLRAQADLLRKQGV